jgi:competence protein ComEC
VWLYDSGRLGNPETAVRSISAVLWDRGVYRLDGIILSHADVDHYNALPGLLNRFAVGGVHVSPVMFAKPSNALTVLRHAIDSHQIPLHHLALGGRVQPGDGVVFRTLHPPRAGVGGSDNADSLVIRIDYSGRSMILPGDLEPPGSTQVLSQLHCDCDVLMAPHHGSLQSNPEDFLDWAKPEWVIISGGDATACAVARAEYARHGARVLHTDRAGTVKVHLSRDSIQLRTWKSDPW